MKMRDIKFLNDKRFLKAKGKKLHKMSLQLADGAIMTPIVKSGRIVGFNAVGRNGKAQEVVHMHLKVTKASKHKFKKAKKPTVKKPKPTCWYCRCTDISCVCVPTPCQG